METARESGSEMHGRLHMLMGSFSSCRANILYLATQNHLFSSNERVAGKPLLTLLRSVNPRYSCEFTSLPLTKHYLHFSCGSVASRPGIRSEESISTSFADMGISVPVPAFSCSNFGAADTMIPRATSGPAEGRGNTNTSHTITFSRLFQYSFLTREKVV